jgi:hypothetical protein
MITAATATEKYFRWLLDPQGGNCVAAKDLGDGVYAAIKPLLFHWTMIVGEIDNYVTILDRWCYKDRVGATHGLLAWNGNGDPSGWNRHINTGRRRPDGDATREYIAA